MATTRKRHASLPVAGLKVDHAVQRLVQPARIEKLVTQWNPAFAGTIVVSERDNGDQYIIDGQHRAEALKTISPEGKIDAEVHKGLTAQQEAEMFLALNKNRKAVHPHDNYRIALLAGHPDEVRLDREAGAVGLKITTNPGDHNITAIQSVLPLVKPDVEVGTLTTMLSLMAAAWGYEAGTWNNMVLRAMGGIFVRNHNIEHERFIKILQRKPLHVWMQKAQITQATGGGTNSRAVALARLWVAEYNKGLHKKDKKLRQK